MSDKGLKVLIVEDSASDAFLLEQALSGGRSWRFETLRAERLSDALEALRREAFDVVLLDLTLPDSRGLESFARLRREAPALPVVILSSNADERLALQAVQAGAQDYLMKGQVHGPDVLARSVRHAIERRRADLSRDEALSIASHEIKTPLTGLLLELQGIRREADAGSVLRSRAERGLAEGRALEQLVDELLDIGRLAAGRLVLDRRLLDLAALVREVVRSRLETEIRVAADNPVVGRWDPLRLRQVLVNLLSNAVKYGGGKPVDVEVSGPDGLALLRVRDRGIGISPEFLHRVFLPFERDVHAGGDGLGLGLYIARSIVEAHGGSIAVESRRDAGSIFTVRLPKGEAA